MSLSVRMERSTVWQAGQSCGLPLCHSNNSARLKQSSGLGIYSPCLKDTSSEALFLSAIDVFEVCEPTNVLATVGS